MAQDRISPNPCPGCGGPVTYPANWRGRRRTYCGIRCWTQNGPYGSARNGRLQEQHQPREIRPA